MSHEKSASWRAAGTQTHQSVPSEMKTQNSHERTPCNVGDADDVGAELQDPPEASAVRAGMREQEPPAQHRLCWDTQRFARSECGAEPERPSSSSIACRSMNASGRSSSCISNTSIPRNDRYSCDCVHCTRTGLVNSGPEQAAYRRSKIRRALRTLGAVNQRAHCAADLSPGAPAMAPAAARPRTRGPFTRQLNINLHFISHTHPCWF